MNVEKVIEVGVLKRGNMSIAGYNVHRQTQDALVDMLREMAAQEIQESGGFEAQNNARLLCFLADEIEAHK